MQKSRTVHNSHNSWAERAFAFDGGFDEAEGVTYRILRFLGRGGMGEVYHGTLRPSRAQEDRFAWQRGCNTELDHAPWW